MTATLQFDPTFSVGHRSAFAWPGHLDHASSASSILPSDLTSDLTSITSHGSDVSLTPPSIARSITSSPPLLTFTPEGREHKRRRDRARREARLTDRLQRAGSSSSSYMGSPPPMAIPDVTSAMAMPMPMYSSSPAMSLMTEPSSLSGSPYMSSYSPPMPDNAGTASVFPTPYQQPLPSYGMPMEYGSYPPPSDYSSSSLPNEPSLMYQVPSILNPNATSVPDAGHVRVVQSRPKPRCWEHGCNGRQFSTFSNLLRHQREKSGQASKSSCPNCGAEFTRTTARNGHMLHDKCKQRRSP